ncbi:hypothetical protein CO726_03665 [Bacillus fungorum]|uniref:Uncharacterized protein n=1 Tax=Bacillus fungorum TaxID=2039284 RepID=A0A2G6QJP5_9BACI|nr:hypothetical protein CO726_03665 [Bacillus fungorum]
MQTKFLYAMMWRIFKISIRKNKKDHCILYELYPESWPLKKVHDSGFLCIFTRIRRANPYKQLAKGTQEHKTCPNLL